MGRRLRLRGLGDDGGDGSGDGGGGVAFIDPGTFDGGGGGGIGPDPSSLTSADWQAIADGTYVPPPDATFSPAAPGSTVTPDNVFTNTSTDFAGTGGVPVYTLPDGSAIDASGTTYFPDGSQMTAMGTYTDPQGNTTFSDGSQVLSDGTYIDPQGNEYPPAAPQSRAAQGAAAAAKSGGGGSGGGAAKGSPQPSLNPCQMFPTLNIPGCPRTTPAANALQQRQQQLALQNQSGSFSSFMSQYGGWIIAAVGAALILPPLLNSGGR